MEERAYPQRPRLMSALAAAQAVPTHDIAAKAHEQQMDGPRIGEMIHKARIEAVTAGLS